MVHIVNDKILYLLGVDMLTFPSSYQIPNTYDAYTVNTLIVVDFTLCYTSYYDNINIYLYNLWSVKCQVIRLVI